MLQELRADVARYPGTGLARLTTALRCAGFYAVVVYRFGHDVHHRWPRPLAVLGKVLYKPLAFFCEWATGVFIAPDAEIGAGLYVGHWGCIRIGRETRMGESCSVSPMVIIGFGSRHGTTGTPVLGDRVYVATGAKIIGPVRVGSGVAVGANAVVCRDVPDGVTVGGVPARIISHRGSAPYLALGQALESVGGSFADEEEELLAAATPLS